MIPVPYYESSYVLIKFKGKDYWYTEYRIDPETLPKGLFKYDFRHVEDDWTVPCQLAKYIPVNYMGTIITDKEIDLSEDGSIIVEENDFEYIGPYVKKGQSVLKLFNIIDPNVPDYDMINNWLRTLYAEEIEEIKGTISNEHLAELGYSGDGPNPHTWNIINFKEYLKILEDRMRRTI